MSRKPSGNDGEDKNLLTYRSFSPSPLVTFCRYSSLIHSLDMARPSKQNILYIWHKITQNPCFPHFSELFDVSDLLKPENETFFFLDALLVFRGTACGAPSHVSLVCPSVNPYPTNVENRVSS